ncbi:hypothetical protein LTR95_007796 [Oleoguttula sp. CCFEE 5521]
MRLWILPANSERVIRDPADHAGDADGAFAPMMLKRLFWLAVLLAALHGGIASADGAPTDAICWVSRPRNHSHAFNNYCALIGGHRLSDNFLLEGHPPSHAARAPAMMKGPAQPVAGQLLNHNEATAI